jgi:RNA polymerase sigma-70 factor, ECF subfamily
LRQELIDVPYALPLRMPAGKMGFTASTVNRDSSVRDESTIDYAVRQARDGNRDALHFLYVRYSDNVYGYVRSIVRDDYEAEDITQHVFAKLMSVLHSYEAREVPFLGWLLRLARNAAVDHVRRRRATPAEEIFGADERLDESRADRSHCLRAALETLPAEQRNVVVLRHVVGLTPPEIADRIGRSESAVHGLHHRGRRALKAALLGMDSGPSTAGSRLAA